jgi:hypothetical protein
MFAIYRLWINCRKLCEELRRRGVVVCFLQQQATPSSLASVIVLSRESTKCGLSLLLNCVLRVTTALRILESRPHTVFGALVEDRIFRVNKAAVFFKSCWSCLIAI